MEMSIPKEEWLKEYSKPLTIRKNSKYFDRFLKWAKVTDVELVEEYKTSDPREFAKKWGTKIVQYYNDLIKQGYKTNYARTLTITPRAFFKSQCIEVKIKRGAIAKPKMAMGEHEFLLSEFQRMWKIGDIQDKARLSTAISLGWGAKDFLSLQWNFIEPFLAEDLEPPVGFWYERGKTGQAIRGHLTHEGIEALREWRRIAPDSKYVFSGYNGNHLSHDALNAWLKSLVERAKIETRGSVHFHLMRKFLFSALVNSGMSEIHAKIIIGKSIGISDLTYLQSLAPALREGFMNAEPRFTLTGYTNTNHSKIEQMSKDMNDLKVAFNALYKMFVARMKEEGLIRAYTPTASERAILKRLSTTIEREEE